jgi:signal transduction histidine kinase
VHRFARELRPPLLDDLGLIPALHSFVKSFVHRTRVRVSLTVFAEIEKLNGTKRTVLYRVAQEALTNFDSCWSEGARLKALFGTAVSLQLLGRFQEAAAAYERACRRRLQAVVGLPIVRRQTRPLRISFRSTCL